MSYTYEDLLKAAHSLQINGDFVTVTYLGKDTYTLYAITNHGLEVDLYLDHNWVDGIITVIWDCNDNAISGLRHSDGVIVGDHHQVIMDLTAQIHALHENIGLTGKGFKK